MWVVHTQIWLPGHCFAVAKVLKVCFVGWLPCGRFQLIKRAQAPTLPRWHWKSGENLDLYVWYVSYVVWELSWQLNLTITQQDNWPHVNTSHMILLVTANTSYFLDMSLTFSKEFFPKGATHRNKMERKSISMIKPEWALEMLYCLKNDEINKMSGMLKWHKNIVHCIYLYMWIKQERLDFIFAFKSEKIGLNVLVLLTKDKEHKCV